MPISMALAGPASEVVPTWVIFLVAGGVCPIMAVAAMIVARMPADELAHPLETASEEPDPADSPELADNPETSGSQKSVDSP
jgi:hypothetical protein